MKVLNYNAGRNYTDFIAGEGFKSLKAADERLFSMDSIEKWNVERDRLVRAYKAAYPDYMFEKRPRVESKLVSSYEFSHYKIENHIFESYPGWFVNATVYLPKEDGIYPGVVCPTGHSSKKFPNYTSSAQLLARSGYIAVSFDPPGMQGEHHAGDEDGNNHFEDGVRGYLSGFWSQVFFVIDAIRCIDYLETRKDVDQECGFAMTGISGGGTTTFHANILDERLSCIAPVCCVSDEAELTLEDRYTFCCEGKGQAHWKNGIKFSTMLALSAPVPMLLCCGRNDEVLDYKLAEKTMKNTKKIYNLYGSNHADIYVDLDSGHAYSVPMVNQVARFFDFHLKGIDRAVDFYSYTKDDIEFPEAEQLMCNAVDTATMFTVNMDRFKKVGPRQPPGPGKLAEYLGIKAGITPVEVEEMFKSDLIWVHNLSGLRIAVNDSTDIPGLLLERSTGTSKQILVYADDNDKWKNMENDGFLARKAAFLKRELQENESSVLSIDITGIGELKMEPGFYDLAGWSRSDRLFSYLAIVLGSSVTAQRTMEILSVLNYLKYTGNYSNVNCAAKGIASVPMLYAAYIFGECTSIVLENLPVSYESMAWHVPNKFMPTSAIFNAPDNFEIYEIANDIDGLTLVNPVFADMTILNERQTIKYYGNNTKVILNEEGIKSEIL